MNRGFVKAGPPPEFVKQALYDYDNDRYIPRTYTTPEDLQAACMEGKTFMFPIIFPKFIGTLLFISALVLGALIFIINYQRMYESDLTGYIILMILLLVVEAIDIASIFHRRSEKFRTQKLTLIVGPRGIAMTTHWPGMDPDSYKCECIEWKDVTAIQDVVIQQGGENSRRLEIIDRWSQRDEILANFRVPESGKRRLNSASWRVIVKSREGNMIVFPGFVELSQFPIAYPAFLLSQLIETYWKHYRTKEK